tara:strand:+ start:2397 stop:3272 length:876 start_codon:yes stop_codon:yes gene_type:complete
MVHIAHPVVRLASHGYAVALDPARGGRIVSATYGGLDVLRPEPASGAASALESACFPLVPFSNRIRNGAFMHQGQRYQLGKNWEGDAHAIHGEGWLQPWEVVEATGARLLLRLRGTGWWPWAYECLQEVTLGENGITLSLTLRNTDTRPMPAGLGFHPYFPCTNQTMLRFDAASAAPPMGQGSLVSQSLDAATSFADARPVSETCLDHCYAGWRGAATITQPDSGLQIEIKSVRGAQYCVVYTPADAPYFCFEPVSHCTAAFEAPAPEAAGLRLLSPGEEFALAISIEARL